MKATWLGGASILLENDKITVLVDPALNGSAASAFDNIEPDVIVLTHTHPDHLDTAVLSKFLGRDKDVTVLASEGAYLSILDIAGADNPVLLSPHSVYSECGITFYSVKAEHIDRTAIGVIVDDGEKTYYISGDTLYNFDVIDDVLDLAPDGVDYAFLPINGRRGNMNAKDAADFAYEISAGKAIPIHYSPDELDPREFDFEDALVLVRGVTVKLD